MSEILYKYLDADGGLAMLKNHNLQFTNATQLNDPFDCHPSLIDYSDACTSEAEVWGKKLVEEVEVSHAKNRRDDSWICSLSKNYNSLLMWSYYGSHKGICIGLNREKTKACLSYISHSNYVGAFEMEVQYKDIVEKPDYFHDRLDFLKYQLSTKAKDWAHEQEVRFLLIDPSPGSVPHHPAFVDYVGTHVFHDLSPECFESLYFGGKVKEDTRKKVIRVAKKLNPNIKIYRMRIDPEAFRLKTVLLQE